MKVWTTSKNGMKFELGPKEVEAYKAFEKECNEELLAWQKEKYMGTDQEEHYRHATMDWTYPNTGAIGGLCSVEFTPTSLGNAVVAKCKSLKKEKNITDYDCW